MFVLLENVKCINLCRTVKIYYKISDLDAVCGGCFFTAVFCTEVCFLSFTDG